MTLRHYIEDTGVRLLIRLAAALPSGMAEWLGHRLGDFAFDVVRKRRALVERHLFRVFHDERPPQDIHRLARRIYRHLGAVAMEHARLMGTPTPAIRELLSITGAEHITGALKQGRGVILVTGHFGYWELLGAAVAALGHPVAVVAKDQHNEAVNRRLNAWRERLGMRVIPMASAIRPVMKTLRSNGCVGLLADQDAGPGGVFVRFLGLTASTYPGPARFALRSGAPIIPCFILREGAGRHRVVFEAPIYAASSGNEEDEVKRCVQEYTEALERYVRGWPEQWFWVHRRWKTSAPVNGS